VSDDVAALRAEVEQLAGAVATLTADREHYRELYPIATSRSSDPRRRHDAVR
jgi:hypothetical protein